MTEANKWKLTNKELPKESGMYICTVESEYEEFLGHHNAYQVSFRYFDKSQGSFGTWEATPPWDCSTQRATWYKIPVIAWMEAPKPYANEVD